MDTPPIEPPPSNHAKSASWKVRYTIAGALLILSMLLSGKLGLVGLVGVIVLVGLLALCRISPVMGALVGIALISGPMWMAQFGLFEPRLSYLLVFTWFGAALSVSVGVFVLWAAISQRKVTDEEKRLTAERTLQGVLDQLRRR